MTDKMDLQDYTIICKQILLCHKISGEQMSTFMTTVQ